MPAQITENVAVRMAAIETRRVELARKIGVHASCAEALRELKEALAFERAALERHPYGYGHAGNEWAIQVAIAKLTREASAG